MAPRDLIGLLSQPFEGGGGPSHSTIGLIWENAGAGDYFPREGNKLDRVRYGLRNVRDGFNGPNGRLPARPDLFRSVVEDLGSRLAAQRLIDDAAFDALLRELAPAGTAGAVRAAPGKAPSAPAPNPAFADLFSTFFGDPRPTRQSGPVPAKGRDRSAPGTIFIIHGHDLRGHRHRLANLVNEYTGARATILHDEPSAGRTVIEKVEANAESAAFAIALLTGDDVGGPRDGDRRPRARQNVILELGFFFGRLGRARTAVLIEEGVERPSDIDGLVYVLLDANEAWRFTVLRELSAADIEVSFPKR